MAGGMKRLAKETAVYGLSSIIGRFLNWMLVPMYTRVFTDTGDFGIVTNLYGWVALLLVLLTFGMETGFFRFINKKEETEPMRVYATTMAWVGGLALPATDSRCLELHRAPGIPGNDAGHYGGRCFLLYSFCLPALCRSGLSFCDKRELRIADKIWFAELL